METIPLPGQTTHNRHKNTDYGVHLMDHFWGRLFQKILKWHRSKKNQTSSAENKSNALEVLEKNEQRTDDKHHIIYQDAHLLKDDGLDRYLDRKKFDKLQWHCYPIF